MSLGVEALRSPLILDLRGGEGGQVVDPHGAHDAHQQQHVLEARTAQHEAVPGYDLALRGVVRASGLATRITAVERLKKHK